MDATVDDPVEQRQRPVQQGQAAPAPAPAEARRARLRWPLMLGGIVVAVLLGLAYYLFTGRYVSTDDSALMAAQTTISANIPGRVVELDVHDNQPVHRGQVLFRLDDRPLRIALAEAQAKLATTQLQIRAAEASYRHELANLAAARDTVAYQQREYARQQHLVQSGISSRAQFEQTQHALELAQSELVSAAAAGHQLPGAARRQSQHDDRRSSGGDGGAGRSGARQSATLLCHDPRTRAMAW